MKRTYKLIIEIAIIAILACLMSLGVFTSLATSDDPADSYTVQTAPNEDSSINMWFDYSFRKTFTSDTTSTGMNTFSIYMAKNEIESAQFVLYSDTDHLTMSAEVTPFTDKNGNTVDAEIYYEMYVTTENLATTSIWGSTASNTPIRAGETPDPVVPLAKLKTFKLNGGKSQSFLIRAKTVSESVSGWYSAQLNIKDSAGNIVKTATVYLYVWNYEISEKTELKTAFILNNDASWGGTYTDFYNYFLDNRLNAMDMPGGTTSSTNSYLTNDRVAATRVSSNGLNNVNQYMEGFSLSYANIYNDLAQSENWDSIKDKLYFYVCDEPLSKEQRDIMGDPGGATIDTANANASVVQQYFPGAQTVVPYHENHAYPYYTYHTRLNNIEDYRLKDGFQEMLDKEYVTVWCPQLYAFTPQYELTAYNYTGVYNSKIHSLSATICGVYSMGSEGNWTYGSSYMNWENLFGEAYDRIQSKKVLMEAEGKQYQMWTYNAGWDFGYQYCNHLIESTGLQTKLLFWQLYQNDITGYLYYGSNNWTEYSSQIYDTTVTGAKTTCTWMTNRYTYDSSVGGNSIYGNGVLFYGRSMAKVGVPVVGSLRVEILRDGVEEYQMMSMLSDLKGDELAKSFVNSVSKNVVNYISMPRYDRSSWSSETDDYAVVEGVRRALGNTLEDAVNEGICEHTFDNGSVIKAAGCKTVGTMGYTCTKCGTVKEEIIPARHSVDSTYELVQSVNRTCTASGSRIERCKYCGYKRTITIPSYHEDQDGFVYTINNEQTHRVYCPVCNEELSFFNHIRLYTKVDSTCTEEGYSAYECVCGYQEDYTTIPVKEHNFVNNVCTLCGETEVSIVYGDIDGNGKVNSADLNTLTKYITGTASISQNAIEAADVSGDGKVNSADSNYMIKYISGSISAFPADE